MSVYSKIVWSEGLFLRPQHLQQQDRYFERYVETRCQALRSSSWGLTELEFERDLLMYLAVPLRQPGATEALRDAERDSTVRNAITELEARDSSAGSGEPAL